MYIATFENVHSDTTMNIATFENVPTDTTMYKVTFGNVPTNTTMYIVTFNIIILLLYKDKYIIKIIMLIYI